MSQPLHCATHKRACGAVTVPQGATGSRVFVNGLIPAVEGDPDTHTMLGQLINVLPHNVKIGGLNAIPAISSMAAPDILGIIQHVQGLPIPIQGSQNVFIGQGSGAAGLGMLSSLGGGLNIGELVSSAGQVIGMVQNFTSIGGGAGITQLSNLQGIPLQPGSTIVGQDSGNSFTFTNYFDSRVLTNKVSMPAVETVTNAIQSDGEYIVIDDYYEYFPSMNLTASVITL